MGKSAVVWHGQRRFILDANAVSDLYFDGFARGDIARNMVGAWFAIAELTQLMRIDDRARQQSRICN
jgi:hypothetical protein